MTRTPSHRLANEAIPNSTAPTTPLRKEKKGTPRKRLLDSLPQVDYHYETAADEARKRLGLTEEMMAGVPSITPRLKTALGSARRVFEVLEGDDAPESIEFMAKWRTLSPRDQRCVRIEDVIIAAGLSIRRFWEVLNGALLDYSTQTTKLIIIDSQPAVMRATVDAATQAIPIYGNNEDGEREIIGYTKGDINAQRIFHTITGALPTPKGTTINNLNQVANPPAPAEPAPVERTPLQSMDAFLLDIQAIAKNRQLSAPKPVEIPTELPQGAPEIEYLQIED